VLHRAGEDGEKLREIVRDLKTHCVAAKCAPPLEAFNELVYLCNKYHDLESLNQLVQILQTSRMQVNKITYALLQEGYSYFPPPINHVAAPTTIPTYRSSSSTLHHHHQPVSHAHRRVPTMASKEKPADESETP